MIGRIRTKFLGGRGPCVRRHFPDREAIATLTLTPRVIVGQVAVIAGDDPETRYITLTLEQEGVSVEARLTAPDLLRRELEEACDWRLSPAEQIKEQA